MWQPPQAFVLECLDYLHISKWCPRLTFVYKDGNYKALMLPKLGSTPDGAGLPSICIRTVSLLVRSCSSLSVPAIKLILSAKCILRKGLYEMEM